MGRRPRGDGRRAFLAVVLLGALTSAVFNNDGAVLILTPVVLRLARALDLPPAAALGFLMAGGFIVDAASLPFTVSNLVNILAADAFGMGFLDYARTMVPVDVLSILASAVVLTWYYGRAVPGRVPAERLGDPAAALRDPALLPWGWGVLALLAVGYGASQALRWPVSAVAGAVALALLARAWRSPAVDVTRLAREAPWRIIAFALGMFVIVYALRDAGLLGWVAAGVERAAEAGRRAGPWDGWARVAVVACTGFQAAAMSSVMNNLPAELAHLLAIREAALPPDLSRLAALAAVAGCDLGPKITPIGSLATLLWMHMLRRSGVRVTWGMYCRAGLVLTPPVLAAALLTLWGWTTLAGGP